LEATNDILKDFKLKDFKQRKPYPNKKPLEVAQFQYQGAMLAFAFVKRLTLAQDQLWLKSSMNLYGLTEIICLQLTSN